MHRGNYLPATVQDDARQGDRAAHGGIAGVSGVADDGKDLVIARDYISHGLRSRAEDLASLELDPKPEHGIRASLEREVDAERWTRLDAAIRQAADDAGFIDLRPIRMVPTILRCDVSPSGGW
jgi:type IV secretory pathway VirD2 relaxase